MVNDDKPSFYRGCYNVNAVIAENETKVLAFSKIANPFIGILAVSSVQHATTNSKVQNYLTGYHSSVVSVV